MIMSDSTQYLLPELTDWSFTHTDGHCAGAFEVKCVYDSALFPVLEEACTFRAEQDEEVVFTGVIDECVLYAAGNGIYFEVSGRDMAAVLMDNEAESVEYSRCTLDNILNSYVRPLGITNISAGTVNSLTNFSVQGGGSVWGVLDDFLRFALAGRPRFSPSGQLLIAQDGERVAIKDKNGITSIKYRENRSGVISEMLVKSSDGRRRSTVYNGEFIARGGKCKRVLNVPKKTGYNAMRYTGEYQIARSAENEKILWLTMSQPFFAFAGDTAEVTLNSAGISGTFKIRTSESYADGSGCGTELELVPAE